jgi:chromate transporter
MGVVSFLAHMALFNGLAMGNGHVMLPLVRKALVADHGVITLDLLLYAFALAQVVPGQANLYVASLGYSLYGVVPGLLAVVAINVPAYLMLPVVRCHRKLRHVHAVNQFTRGLTSASVGLILAATLSIARHALSGPAGWVVFLMTLSLNQMLKWSAIVSLATAASAGIMLVHFGF